MPTGDYQPELDPNGRFGRSANLIGDCVRDGRGGPFPRMGKITLPEKTLIDYSDQELRDELKRRGTLPDVIETELRVKIEAALRLAEAESEFFGSHRMMNETWKDWEIRQKTTTTSASDVMHALRAYQAVRGINE